MPGGVTGYLATLVVQVKHLVGCVFLCTITFELHDLEFGLDI